MVSTGYNKVIFFLLFFPALAFATEEKFSIGKKELIFASLPELELRISKNCLQKGGGFDCAAFSATKKLKIKETELASVVGLSPSAYACVKSKSIIVVGLDAGGNQMSFCKFSDESYIDAGSLLQYGIKNGKNN